MDTVRFILGGILPYIAILVFLAGMSLQVFKWWKLPSPPMTLYPSAEGKVGAYLLKELVFFRSLFTGDRVLWVLAWGFHVVLALIFVGHFRVFTPVDDLFMRMGMSEAQVQAMSGGAGGAAGVVILVTAVVLFVRRLALQRAREITGFMDYLVLLLIGSIVFTGDLMRFGSEHFDLATTRAYFYQLFTFSGAASAPVLETTFSLAHMTLAFLLIMAIPFSKILPLGGFLFSPHAVRR